MLLLGCALLLTAPASTLAASGSGATLAPGVHVDPGSPAGKEYAIPLGQARSIGGHRGLFGSGITKPPSTGAGASARPATPPASDVGAAQSPPVLPRANRGHSRVVRARKASRRTRDAPTLELGSGGAGGLEWMLGAAGLVLALGALGGQALTRALRRPGASAGSEP